MRPLPSRRGYASRNAHRTGAWWARAELKRYEHTIEIERTPEEVFAFISEPYNFPLWQESLLEIRDANGPLRVGREVTEVRSFMGRKMETTWTCTEHEPFTRSSIEDDEGLVPFKGTFELESSGSGTSFTWTVETPGPRGIKVPGAIVGRMVKRQLATDSERLKELLEAGGEETEAGVESAA
jgi:carbon monoxide dehydrogenase subunit G